MRNLAITREQFINLKLIATEFEDESVLLDAGEHGLFIGEWGGDDCDAYVDCDTYVDFQRLTVRPTDMPTAYWMSTKNVKKQETTYYSYAKKENGVPYYVLANLSDDDGYPGTLFGSPISSWST